MPAADCCRLLNADYSTLSRFPPRGAFSDRRQLSRGKLNHLQCTTAASTLRALDGYGLRHLALARPTLTPLMRFLFIGSHLCSTLPSDLASRQMPLRFAILHLHQVECGTSTRRVVEHARHTLFSSCPLRGREPVLIFFVQSCGTTVMRSVPGAVATASRFIARTEIASMSFKTSIIVGAR